MYLTGNSREELLNIEAEFHFSIKPAKSNLLFNQIEVEIIMRFILVRDEKTTTVIIEITAVSLSK